MLTATLATLTAGDAKRIAELESNSFIPLLQATEETILERFDLGHTMLGIEEADRLVGMLSFSYGYFDPEDFESFPKTLKALCSQPTSRSPNTVFLYNLEVVPQRRGLDHPKRLVHAALELAEHAGCTYGVANCRIPSYDGSEPASPHERVRPDPAFREVIDRYLEGGRFPDQEEFLMDSTLALYHRLTGCRFHWIIPGFAPADRATGGIRVIAYGSFAGSAWRRARR